MLNKAETDAIRGLRTSLLKEATDKRSLLGLRIAAMQLHQTGRWRVVPRNGQGE
jgi:hypothetical protein